MLRWRIFLGVVFVAGFIGLGVLDARAALPGVFLVPFVVVAAALAGDELRGLFESRPERPPGWIVVAGPPLVVAATSVPHLWPGYPVDCPLGTFGWTVVGIALVVLVAFGAEMRQYTVPGRVAPSLGLAMLAVVYVGLMLSFAIELRFLGGPRRGLLALVSMIAVVKMSDIGQYTVGRLVGRHKLAPVLSPGKTWEGAAGGILFAVGTAWLFFGPLAARLGVEPAAPPTPAWGWLAFGVAVAAAGMFGDLAESLLKRDAGRKDSSRWMPGFGGVLDLADSVLAAAPVAYVLWASGVAGP